MGLGERADLNDAVGEDIDDKKEDAKQDDYMESTNLQKRELLKIHRNLGHPQPESWPELCATFDGP
eukprot:7254341-Karenia_brevis.AAC.1